jgi:hypothetical protein
VTRTDVGEDERALPRPANGGATDACCPALAPERSNERAAWQSSSPKGIGHDDSVACTSGRSDSSPQIKAGTATGHGARSVAYRTKSASQAGAARPLRPRWELRHLFVWPRTRAEADGRSGGRLAGQEKRTYGAQAHTESRGVRCGSSVTWRTSTRRTGAGART